MYKHNAKQLLLPHEFFMPFEGQLNPENRWCKLAAMIPWEIAEERYIESLGNPNAGQKAYAVRMALGTLIIQNKKNLSDRETVAEITENPYLQYFIGLPVFVQEPPFDASLLVHFRKRLGKDIINELNELLFLEEEKHSQSDDDDPRAGTSGGGEDASSKEPENKGNLILDATCVPVDIQYPTDSRLLNDAREALEEIIDVLHAPHVGTCKKPRTYRQRARKQYLRFERKRKHSKREIRKTNGQQLRYVGRNLRIIEKLAQKSPLTLLDNRHAVVYADKIYRNRDNLRFCKKHNICLSGPPLGRPSKDPKVLKEQRKQEREDTKIRNGVEGKFGEGKRFYGLGLVMTRLQETCETVIAMQLLVLNLERKLRILLVRFFSWLFPNQNWALCC